MTEPTLDSGSFVITPQHVPTLRRSTTSLEVVRGWRRHQDIQS